MDKYLDPQLHLAHQSLEKAAHKGKDESLHEYLGWLTWQQAVQSECYMLDNIRTQK